ncbi:MAG: peptidase S16 [Alphaproteobacteria bacterium]|nr:peptidase S16 [Alphaproteobacteria bacterium]
MSINKPYVDINLLPALIPVFPLDGALMLPRGHLPLNIFEPRYMTMIDDALKTERLIGMVQPDVMSEMERGEFKLHSVGCLGRLTQLAETGDGRYIISLTGVIRFKLVEELRVITPYRQCIVAYEPFAEDLIAHSGESLVDRRAVLEALRAYAERTKIKIDWKSIDQASNEDLVNALSMMSPFGPKEKQALLEAPTLKARAEVLVAITEIELARGQGAGSTLQ